LIATQRIRQIVPCLARQQAGISDEVADFWKRSIIDATAATIIDALPAENRGPVPQAMQLVRNVEHYLDTAGSRPVHISEICAQFNVSRRSLHRAFYDMLGLGPVTFLRRKRLCAIHSALRQNTPATATIGEIAMQHGFIELGRFSHYYRSLFGEYPSETLHASKRMSRAIDRRRALATG
jgi:transcriptional regulator GlxA family with amidase domain